MAHQFSHFLIAFLFLLHLGPVGPVKAQDFANSTIGQALAATMIPEGKYGRYSAAQCEQIALSILRGTVIGHETAEQNNKIYYEYTIAVPDGSIYELEINPSTGTLYEIEVESLSAAPVLPDQVIAKDYAELLAVGFVQERERGLMKPQITRSVIEVYRRKLAWSVTVTKGFDEVKVIINAMTAKLMDYKKL